MKANTFPLNDGGNAAAARKESVDGPSSFPRANPSDRSNGPARRDERVKATSPITGSGSVQTHKLPRNLPKLDARNMPSLTQLGPVRRMPGAMAATSNLGIVRPRKLAPLKLTHADKGKQFFNAGSLLQVAESPCAAVGVSVSITNFNTSTSLFFFFSRN